MATGVLASMNFIWCTQHDRLSIYHFDVENLGLSFSVSLDMGIPCGSSFRLGTLFFSYDATASSTPVLLRPIDTHGVRYRNHVLPNVQEIALTSCPRCVSMLTEE
jgi:hypothetical protein